MTTKRDPFRTLDDPDPTPRGADDSVRQTKMPDWLTRPADKNLGVAEDEEVNPMVLSVHLVCLLLATVCFLLGAFTVSVHPRINVIALGLFFWMLSLMFRV